MGLLSGGKGTFWIKRTHLFGKDTFECSGCGRSFARPSASCPGCRAKMKKIRTDGGWIDDIEMLDAILDD